MGLGILEIRLLEKLIRAEKIRSVASLGRPALMLPNPAMERAYLGQVVPDNDRDTDGFPFWEPWLKRLSIRRSLSVDVSRHEGATLVHDLNQPLPAGQRRRWDLVIDPGTCEHAWNYAQAVQNAADLARSGGWLFFNSPCEGMAGHGFFQISPEFF